MWITPTLNIPPQRRRNAFDAMLYDAAGDVVLNQAVAAVATQTAAGRSVLKDHDPCPPLKIYKNNVDGKGASYGAHENYMVQPRHGF